MDKKIIAVDFDGTIVVSDFPHIGEIKQNVVDMMRIWKQQGHTVVVWTCRTEEHLDDAIVFLAKNNIPYDAINTNHNSPYGGNGGTFRKVYADVYLDDKSLNVDDLEGFNLDTLSMTNKSVLNDMKVLLNKAKELANQTVHPQIEEVLQIAHKYGL